MTIVEHDRRRADGFWFTWRQLAGALGLIISTQLGINYFALRALIREEVKAHNESKLAHPETLMVLSEQRAQMSETIATIKVKLDGIENMLRDIASRGGLNVPLNGNSNGNGRSK